MKYKMFLSSIENVGHSTIRRLVDTFGGEKNVYEAPLAAIEASNILTPIQYKNYERQRLKWDLERKIDMQCVAYGDAGYPEKLNNISNPPYMLYYYGSLPKNNIPSVAIIGARNCSEYGRSMAKYYAEGLSERGIQIISGMASGIDGVAGRGALYSSGKSFAILGCGVDVCYPLSNKPLYDELKEKGGVISEYYPGTKPSAYHFPVRNRIISGLADIVLVVEAKEQSGTMITVNMALEQGKEVYAVPGRVTDALSSGCNRLIKEGAGIATTIDSITEFFDFKAGYKTTSFDKTSKMNEIEKKIYRLLEDKSMTIDEIYLTDVVTNFEELSVVLFGMQLEDYITVEGGRYCAKY